MSEEQKEKKKYDDGTLSTNHLTVESAKYNTPIKKLDGSTYNAARIMCSGDFGTKEIKISEKVLAAPFRAALAKQVKDVCDAFKIAFANDETIDITYVSKYNAATGSNLKAPQPQGGKRKDSFCARMSGMPGPMKDEKGKPTRKAASLARWKC